MMALAMLPPPMKAMRVDAMEVGSCFMGTDLTRAHRGLAGGGQGGTGPAAAVASVGKNPLPKLWNW
jgi:hypothetical protein